MTACVKRRYPSEDEARDAAFSASRSRFSPKWKFSTYRCTECRFDSGKRAWHWGHQRPARFGGRRKVKR